MKNIIAVPIIAFLLIASGCAQRVVVDNNNRGPIMVNTPDAVYPPEAAAKGIEGEVWVRMWVDEKGNVSKAMIERSPDQSLSSAAMEAALKLRFKPSMSDGKPIGVWLIIPIPVKNPD
jgi:TonB family protein